MDNKWVIMNTKKKMTITEAIVWFGSRNSTLIECQRHSERGLVESIYVIGASSNYGKIGETVDYITDTGKGYGGKGRIKITGIANVHNGAIKNDGYFNMYMKKPIWVFK